MIADTVTKRPRFAGVYTAAEAAALIQATRHKERPISLAQRIGSLERISSRHLYGWVRHGLAGDYLVGLRGEEVALTFLDLVSLRLVSVLREHGISTAEIGRAHTGLQEARGWSHPFAMEPIWISGPGVYVREHEIPMELDRNSNWQAVLDSWELLEGSAHRLAFGEDLRASAWEPEDGIVLDPNVSFGEPCLRGTRIATQTLWALHAAGDSAERIASAYEVPVERVEAALAWERRLGYNGAS